MFLTMALTGQTAAGNVTDVVFIELHLTPQPP